MQNISGGTAHLWLRLLSRRYPPPPTSPLLSINGSMCVSRKAGMQETQPWPVCLGRLRSDPPPFFSTYWRHGHISPCRGSCFHYFRLSICVDSSDTSRSLCVCVSLCVSNLWPSTISAEPVNWPAAAAIMKQCFTAFFLSFFFCIFLKLVESLDPPHTFFLSLHFSKP